ncbi:MAG TPA: hypothetical protein IAD46_02005 [Candidatus Pelethenecus faecipullorum]|uniref:Uncharacterized protein n=1 Tax=Candidatus Pelethenecus faecipullorum TaxID=2840900 RepID=A0A9D1GQV4_9MOLU|nr:hypothetical protein [Candidatus Pelethenecus faecipullorum]
MFAPYKFVVEQISDMNGEEQALYMYQIYAFLHTELIQFIATHPEETEAIETLKKVNIEKKKMEEYIDMNNAPLSSCSVLFDGYLNRKMTWEVQ